MNYWNWDEITDLVNSKFNPNQLCIDSPYVEFFEKDDNDSLVLLYYNHAEEKLFVLDDFIETKENNPLHEVDLHYTTTIWKCEWKEVDSLYELGEALNHFKYILKVYRMQDDF